MSSTTVFDVRDGRYAASKNVLLLCSALSLVLS